MTSSDDEVEAMPDAVSNYYFVDAKEEPLSFSELPVQWNENESLNGNKKRIFLHGTTDNGLQKLYKQVTAWKCDFSGPKPEISVLSKENNWIKLQKPRKSFEDLIRTVLVTTRCLHFLKKNPEASARTSWDHVSKVFSLYDPRPSENDLIDHMDFISEAVKRDASLTKSKFLVTFLEEKPRKRKAFDEYAGTTGKPGFIVDDVIDELEEDELPIKETDDESDEENDLFDSVCAICDNGGDLLCCEGKCLRSFHATLEAGSYSECKSLGMSDKEVEEIQTFFCANCRYNRHQCFACGELGTSDKSFGAEVFRCSSATCGHFYHPRCVAKLLHRESEDEAKDLQEKIVAGEPFTCPAHKCYICKHGENEMEPELQFAICRRCPRSYHRKCLPRKIVFHKDDDDDEDIIARAWEGLLPQSRILIYCLKHEIDDEISTPKRNHIKFPNKERRLVSDISIEKRSALKPPKGVEILSSAGKPVDSSKKRAGIPRSESFKKQKVPDSSQKPSNRTSLTKVNKLTVGENKTSLGSRLYDLMNKESLKDDSAVIEHEQTPTTKPLGKSISSLPLLDADSKKRILAIMKDATSSVTLEQVIKQHKMPLTHSYSSRNAVDKTITLGKVEGSVEALRLALKKLEEGCSIEDAKAVCEPGVLNQMLKWKEKLRIYLSPFLYGMRYTSFGRHFTKVDKLKEIVNMLRWYVEDGDMIVDFCCGANDFSCLMKERLEEMGKNCSFKNYDLLPAKNDFNFEMRDWLSTSTIDLPPGSKLIMGLNPPFGVAASLANKFIDQALHFKPKLLVLIVPPETQRLDKKKKNPYDLVWEDDELLAGKSFYLPGSVDIHDKQIEQWNVIPPPLYLWSRPDWTAKHKAIAQQHGHPKVCEEFLSVASHQVLDFPKENHAINGEVPASLDSLPVTNEEPVQISKKPAASVNKGRKEGFASDGVGTGDKANYVHGKNKSTENSKKVPHDKGKRVRESDERSSVEKHKQRGSPLLRAEAPEMPSHMDIAKEGDQLVDHTESGSRSHYNSGYARNREGDVARRYSTNIEEPYAVPTYGRSTGTEEPYVDLTYGRNTRTEEQYAGSIYIRGRNIEESYVASKYGRLDDASLGTDYRIRKPEQQFPGYQQEIIENRGYGRSLIGDVNEQYGMESDVRSSLTQRGSYMSSRDAGFPAPYEHLDSAADPPYNRVSSSTMQRYAPRLDELNHMTRMHTLGSEPSLVSRSVVYNPPVLRPGFPEPLGFASGPYRPFSQQNSSGWLNE